MPLVQSDLNIISNSRGPWVLYEIMPVDSHSLFAQIKDPGQLKALLPESANKDQPQEIRDEYANDGKPIDANNPEKSYVRGSAITPPYSARRFARGRGCLPRRPISWLKRRSSKRPSPACNKM